MNEREFTIGQRFQDARGGRIGIVARVVAGVLVEIKWTGGDSSCFAWGPACRWLRLVSYDLAELRGKP